MRKQGPSKNDEEGKVKRLRRGALHFPLNDIESTEGCECCPNQYKPPCPVIVGMNIIRALAFLHDSGCSHTYEHKDVKDEYNLFYHKNCILHFEHVKIHKSCMFVFIFCVKKSKVILFIKRNCREISINSKKAEV